MAPDKCRKLSRHWYASALTGLLAVWSCLLLAPAPAAAQTAADCAATPTPITLDSRGDDYFPALHGAVAEIPPGIDGFSAMRDGTATLRPLCERQLRATTPGDDIWLAFSVDARNAAATNWVLAVNEQQAAEISLMEALPNGSVRVKRNGADVADAERDMTLRRLVVGLAPATEGLTRYFVRIKAGVAPTVTLQIQSFEAYQSEETSHLIVAYTFIGFLAAIALDNLNLYFNLRVGAALFYVFYVAFMIVNTAVYEGLVLWLTPWHWTRASLDFLQEFSAFAAGLALIQYCRLLLGKTADRTTKGLMAVLVIVFGLHLPDPPALSWLPHLAYIAGTLLLCVLFCRRASQGDRPARLVSFSFMSLFAGVGTQTLLYYLSGDVETILGMSWLTSLWAIDGTFYLGIAGEAVLMSMAMMVFVSQQRPQAEEAAPSADPALEDRNRRYMAALDAAIDAHISDHDLGVGALADHLATSERTLRRRLHEIEGATLAVYIRARRLERARALIEAEAFGTVAEVAHAVGLSHTGHFARLYRDAFGSAPRDDLRLATQNNGN